MTSEEQRTMFRLRTQGLATMTATGQWGPTRKGEEMVAELTLLRKLVAAREIPGPRGMIFEDERAGRRGQQGTT